MAMGLEREPCAKAHVRRQRSNEGRGDYTRRIAGGLTVGAGLRRDASSRGAARVRTIRLRDADASAQRRSTRTIVPIANATPMQSATTVTFASVSLPAGSA